MNNLKDYTINGIVESTEFDANYRYEIHALVNDELKVPAHVKSKYKTNSVMMLVLFGKRANPKYDFNTRELSWVASFNGTASTVIVPIQNILGVIDRKSNCSIGLSDLQVHQDTQSSENKEKIEDVTVTNNNTKPKMKLGSYNKNVESSKSKASLKVVK